ncbi:unknown [Bacteroides sp. CAG:709]|nr:unknown [Bacteroides sp. CAG:709]
MKTICITVIVMNVISAVTCVIIKDWTNVLNNVALALSWRLILKYELDNYHDKV